MNPIRTQILEKALELAPKCGWSDHSLHLAARQLGLPATAAGLAGKSKLTLIRYFYEQLDEQTKLFFKSSEISSLVPVRR